MGGLSGFEIFEAGRPREVENMEGPPHPLVGPSMHKAMIHILCFLK
jgi:hypothetical protein